MTTVVAVPSIGAPTLDACLAAILAQEPRPDLVVAVLSGAAAGHAVPDPVRSVRSARRLGFAAAVNAALAELPREVSAVGIVNDDVVVGPGWLDRLQAALAAEPGAAAVQGTLTDGRGDAVDGRGVRLDRYGLPVQVDHGLPATPEPARRAPILAASATAALYRREALDAARLANGAVFDASFGSYHEDLDLGLRLCRLEWGACWVAGAPGRHLGSLSGRPLRWRHPWWLVANRWRALAGNLTATALLQALPRLLRGELRAVRTLARGNLRALPVAVVAAAALPVLVTRGLARPTPGPRLARLPGVTS